jgi:radical SAM protein with 4Fe4S-binding SPASM domain
MKSSNRLRRRLREALPLRLQTSIFAGLRMTQAIYRRPRGYRNSLLNMISQFRRSITVYGKPVSVTIEPTNVCNLHCPICETGAGILNRKAQMMAYDDFVKIMDKVGPGANHLIFYYMGEPFLNREACRMIRYARDMGLYVMTCTNGNVIDPERLYESGINQISFQIGGVTQKTHGIYRVNSDLGQVIDNLAKYLKIIRQKGRKPTEHRVELGFIVMRHNEAEIAEFLKMAEHIGVDRVNLISPCVRTPQQARDYLPQSDAYWIYDRRRFEEEGLLIPKRIYPKNSCPWLSSSITIQVNGDVVPCCRDALGKHVMGNLIEQSLEAVWNGPGMGEFRKAIFMKQETIDLCRLCPGEGPAPLFW